jgi:hypothetical protein
MSNAFYRRDDMKGREWDYVPDGLLVWETWLEWQQGIWKV